MEGKKVMDEKSTDALNDYFRNKRAGESEVIAKACQRAARMREWKEKESKQECRIYIPGKEG